MSGDARLEREPDLNPAPGAAKRDMRCPSCAAPTLGVAARIRFRTVQCGACGARFQRRKSYALRFVFGMADYGGFYVAAYQAVRLAAWWPLWAFGGAFVLLAIARIVLTPLAPAAAGKRAQDTLTSPWQDGQAKK